MSKKLLLQDEVVLLSRLNNVKYYIVSTEKIGMRELLLLSFFSLLSLSIKAECIKTSVKEYLEKQEKLTNLTIKKVTKHVLTYAEDSCGAKGCEIRVFTKVNPVCYKETLTKKGFYIDKGLSPKSVHLKIDGKLKIFHYEAYTKRFR